MCLLITQESTSPVLGDDWIEDFYWYNSDGIGVMYADKGEIIVQKSLPKDKDEAIKFWREHVDGKDAAIHLRMRTHGNVDLDNCHPYLVLPGLWLMHNGILSIGNAEDQSKSDTWHYIERYLKPLLKGDIDLAFDDAFIDVISGHIGSGNKFVMMDYQGRIAHYNYKSGVLWEERWMSNTYAWTTPGRPKRQGKSYYGTYYGGRESVYDQYDYEWEQHLKDQRVSLYPTTREVTVSFVPEEDMNSAPNIPVEFEVDEVLDFCDSAGFYKAAGVSRPQAIRFAEKFDASALWDLAEMLGDGDIDEYQFIRFISDFRLYREMVCGC